jgi:hypothetical protein
MGEVAKSAPPEQPIPADDELLVATRRELAAAGTLGHYTGQLALLLAERFRPGVLVRVRGGGGEAVGSVPGDVRSRDERAGSNYLGARCGRRAQGAPGQMARTVGTLHSPKLEPPAARPGPLGHSAADTLIRAIIGAKPKAALRSDTLRLSLPS